MSREGSLPRLLTIMGSGETAPTMVKIHRAMLERLGPPPVAAVVLDTPYGFEENAAELSEKIKHYFAESLRTEIAVASAAPGASLESGDDPFADDRVVSAVRGARYVFAGPGSPTYALRRWAKTVVPSLLHEKLRHGGGVTFSSAAALTLGVKTIPVYEIYKVGEDPHWLAGLDVLSETGLSAAVIPHYNNAEGGTHDTRFCYLGERRLSEMERELPEGSFVLGVDEHTSVTFDLDSGGLSVGGLGVLTIRSAGRTRTFPAGEVLKIDDVRQVVEELGRGEGATVAAGATGAAGAAGALGSTGAEGDSNNGRADVGGDSAPAYADSPLIAVVREQEELFSSALAARDLEGAVAALLSLESQITEWANDIPAGDAMDRARASFRSLVLELGRIAETGARDPRSVVGPFVDTLLELRSRARVEKRFEESDLIRDRLGSLGVEVRDTPDGSEWVLV